MSELKQLFEYLRLAEYKHITKDFVKRCSGEYTSAIKNIPYGDRKNYFLIDYLLTYCENENWKSAINTLDKASKEYTKLRSKLPDEIKQNKLTTRIRSDVGERVLTPDVQLPSCYSGDHAHIHKQQTKRSQDTPWDILTSSEEARKTMRNIKLNSDDLSDANRPTKIAERFAELYDYQWENAHASFIKCKLSEETTIQCLLQIVQAAYGYCRAASESQIKSMKAAIFGIVRGFPSYDKKGNCPSDEGGDDLLVQYRRIVAGHALERLQQDFIKYPSPLHDICSRFLENKPSENGPVAMYALKCVELTWWMCVQSPPICMHDCDEKQLKFDSSLYKAYTKSGKELAFFVWPALYLHEGGPVLMKGVAHCR